MEPISILDAIEYLDKAWREIIQSTISNCFRKACYKTNNQQQDSSQKIIRKLNEEDDDWAINKKPCLEQWEQLIKTKKSVQFPTDFNSPQDFLDLDNDLTSYGLLTDEK